MTKRTRRRASGVAAALRAALRAGDVTPVVARTLGAGGRPAVVAEVAAALEPVLERVAHERRSPLARASHRIAHALGVAARRDEGRLERLRASRCLGIAFVDVVDFTHYTASHGDDAAIDLLVQTGELVARAVDVGNGELVKRLGDGFLLAFPSPSQAVRAALTLSESTRRRKARALPAASLRIAVHAGEPVVEPDDLVGHDVNLAARLLEQCPPDEVLVSGRARDESARRLRTVAFGAPRAVRMRGIEEPVVVHRAVRVGRPRG